MDFLKCRNVHWKGPEKRNKPNVVATTAKHPDSHSQILRYGWMQPMYMRSVTLWGKFTSGSCISASRSDLLKLPTPPCMEEMRSGITSIFGNIIKMDSTKKILKKLAGHSAGTAYWAPNVANEKGQILMSVLTASEGVGLAPMAAGLMKRYSDAKEPPPKVLYVDCDCCGGGAVKVKDLSSMWPGLIISLDIWHFMRQLALGCTTKSHPLYGVVVGHLSQCIF